MEKRLQLSQLLHDILGKETGVYYQPPSNTRMEYPCIIYGIDDVLIDHADNRPYRLLKRWIITVIDRDPDSKIWEKILELPTASYVRSYPADDLNHHVINLHF